MKDDERKFLKLIFDKCACRYDEHNQDGVSPRDVVNSGIEINYKRCWYLLEKWCGKDWYEYGVTLDLGWLTPKGIEIAKGL